MKRHSVVVFVALFAVLGLMLLSASQGGAKLSPRSEVALQAKSQQQIWRSPELFGPRQTVYLGVYVGKFLLNSHERSHCILLFQGRGINAVVNDCGHNRVPIRLHYRSTNGQRIPFSFVYERG